MLKKLFITFSLLIHFVFAQDLINQVELYILHDKLDSASFTLKKAKPNEYTQILNNIIENKATTSQLLVFASKVKLQNKFEYERFNSFLKSNLTSKFT